MNKKIVVVGAISVVIIFIAVNIIKDSGLISSFGKGNVTSVTAHRINKGSISSTISASGTVTEIYNATVCFDKPLKVNKLLVKKYQKVKNGEKLLEIDISELQTQLVQLLVKKDILELEIKKLHNMDSTKETSSLDAIVETSKNGVASAQKEYDRLQKKLSDSKYLYENGAISKSELDTVQKAVEDAGIALENAKINYKSAEDKLSEGKKTNLTAENNNKIEIQTQEGNLKSLNLQINDLQNKISSIEKLQLSPIDGVVSELNVEDGAYTQSNQPSIKIVNTDSLQVNAMVKEFDGKDLAVGQKVNIVGDAISKDECITGKVASIAPVTYKNSDFNNGEAFTEVVISIDKSIPGIKIGNNVTCDIFTQELKDVLLADLEMFRDDKDGNKSVFIVEEKTGFIHEKKIKLGVNSDMMAQVIDGLKEGDVVVVGPKPTLKDGMKVKTFIEDGSEVGK